MNPGTLRERITITKNTLVADGLGGSTDTWATLATVWAEIRPLTSKELEVSGQVQAQGGYRVTIRSRSDVTAAMRITWGSRTLEINGVVQVNPELLRLDCSEVVA